MSRNLDKKGCSRIPSRGQEKVEKPFTDAANPVTGSIIASMGKDIMVNLRLENAAAVPAHSILEQARHML